MSATSPSALAGATLVVTRPAGACAALVARARRLGAEALALPGLSLRMAADPAVARALETAAREADLWIFTSPAAVRFAFRLAPDLRIPPHTAAFGVGAGTRRALARVGVAALAPERRRDSEGLLALPQLAAMDGRRVALIGAPGGRDLIASTLRGRGAQVEPIYVHERRAPRLTRRHFDALAAASDPLVLLLSSAAALGNLIALLPPALLARLRGQMLVASSERLAAIAREHGFAQVSVAASAMPDDLLDAARHALARHRL
jgi:uroporphyrinogen-III synthase